MHSDISNLVSNGSYQIICININTRTKIDKTDEAKNVLMNLGKECVKVLDYSCNFSVGNIWNYIKIKSFKNRVQLLYSVIISLKE